MGTSFGRRLLARLRIVSQRHRFSRRRADYYEYLGALLQGDDGSRTLKDVFATDAARYGDSTLRGKLSRYWVHAYQRAGGDLYAAWFHHFPHDELALIRAAQSLGNHATVQAINQLGSVVRLTQAALRILYGTLWPAAVAGVMVMIMSLAVPWFTVPHLVQTFSQVPADHYGSLTRRLMAFAVTVDRHYLLFAVCVAGATWGVMWSMANMTGPLRRKLDHYLWWDIYRCVIALRFFAFLGIALGEGDQNVTRLRSALLLQRSGASVWLASHIDDMLSRIDQGMAGPATFDTGLLSREHYWFLSDMILARGLRMALTLVHERLREHVLGAVARQAAVLRWAVLLAGVAFMLGLALWHYAVIDELRRALTFYFTH